MNKFKDSFTDEANIVTADDVQRVVDHFFANIDRQL